MSNYIAGVVILALTDVVLALFGLTVYRSRAMSSHKGLPAVQAAGISFGALVCHFIALYYAAGLTQDKLTVLALTVVFGLVPGAIYAVILRDAFADRAINLIMGAEDGLDKPDMTKARAYAVKGDLGNARGEYLALAKRYPQSPEPLFGLESVYMLERRYDDAANVCRDILRKFGSDARTRNRAALRLAELLEEHLDDPGGAAVARAQADAAAKVGWQPVKGEREQRAAAKVGVKPLTDRVSLESARYQVKRGEINEAVETYRKFFQLNPGHPRPMFEAVTALERDGQYERALEFLREIARQFPESPDHWGAATLHQGTIYEMRLGDLETARRIMKTVEDRLPGTDFARVALDRLAELRAKAGE